jgi:DNA-binding NarL/FixJ family response regulator
MSKTVLIAESNSLFAQALVDIVSFLGYEVVASTSKSAEVQSLTEKFMPDLLIYDFNLSEPSIKSLTDLKPLKKQFPNMKIFFLGFHEAADTFEKMAKNAGYDGFYNKFESRDGFIEKLRLILP